jgi:alkylation response protein AidB-like acyl-CoA dehydrogenase
MLHAVASTFDAGHLTSMVPVMQAKVFCSEIAAHVTQELMTMFGGTAFASRLPFERYFRDARGPDHGLGQRCGVSRHGEHVIP